MHARTGVTACIAILLALTYVGPQPGTRLLGTAGVHLPHDGWAQASAAGQLELDPLAVVLTDHADLDLSDEHNRAIAELQARIRGGDLRLVTLERLGWAFVAKARHAEDGGFFELAEQCANAIERRYPGAAAAKLLRGHALHSLHRFAQAEVVATGLAAERGSPLDYALLGDVLFDEGRIDEATAAYRRLMRLRPDSSAYTRAAEVRRIRGDITGAAEAMRLAASAVSRRDADTYAWTWSRLADLEFQAGRFAEARAAAAVALARVPGFAQAEIVIAKVELAQGRADSARAALELAAQRRPLPDVLWLLAETHRFLGEQAEADRVEAKLLATGEHTDPRGLAAFLAETGRDPRRAVALARGELDKRADIYTFDTLALALLSSGDVAGARTEIEHALALGTRDGRLFYHAGSIAAAAHDIAKAREWFAAAEQLEHMLLPSERAALEPAAVYASNESQRRKT